MRTVEQNALTIRALWPKWEPNAETAAVWRDTLEPWDQDVAYEAIRNAFRASTWSEPSLKAVIDEYRRLRVDERRYYRKETQTSMTDREFARWLRENREPHDNQEVTDGR